MLFHDPAVEISFSFNSISLNCFDRRQRLEAKFTDVSVKAVVDAEIIGLPIVAISTSFTVRVKKSGYQTMLAHVGSKSFYDIVFEKLGDTK